MNLLPGIAASVVLSPLIAVGASLQEEPSRVDLSPARWPAGDLEKYAELQARTGTEKPAATSEKGVVAATTGALAVRAGLEALRQGGSAADAVCTTALAQIALIGGSTVSYAGILTALYYEAETGEVHMVFAPFGAPLEEDDPMSIPGAGVASGRTALVPGFMKGIEALHGRFGELPFATLFDPAIHFAEEGIMLTENRLGRWIEYRQPVLSRLPATKAVFTGEDGEFLGAGDLFRQPALASTLRAVAADGVEVMYEGAWARRFVKAVRADGGKIVEKDLADYEVVWSEPLRAAYNSHEVCAPATFGGGLILESLNLLELADPAQYGHYGKSAEALFWLMTCSRATYVLMMTPAEILEEHLPGLRLDNDVRASEEHASRIWEKLKEPGWLDELRDAVPGTDDDPSESGGHSAGIVAIDAKGNVAAVCHSINTAIWGTTGIMVDGVSIPDAAFFQQWAIEAAGPGGHVDNGMNPLIVLRDGEPVLASSTIGSGLHDATLSCVHNAIDFGLDPAAVQREPVLLMPYFEHGGGAPTAMYRMHCVNPDEHPPEVLEGVRALGQPLFEASGSMAGRYSGYWVGVAIDPESGVRTGGAPTQQNGLALAE